MGGPFWSAFLLRFLHMGGIFLYGGGGPFGLALPPKLCSADADVEYYITMLL